MIDAAAVLIVVGLAYIVASEGAFGAGLTFLCVLFSGLLAMNFFEPLANLLGNQSSGLDSYADLVALLGLFTLLTFLSRMATDHLAPTMINLDVRLYHAGRWLFGVLTGYVTMAILMTSLHTAPLPRTFLGFTPERKNLFNIMAPDRQWLGFTQHVSEKIFRRGRDGRIFDGLTYQAPGTKQPEVWSSFPIRYASRRTNLARGGKAAAASPAIQTGSGTGGGGSTQPSGF